MNAPSQTIPQSLLRIVEDVGKQCRLPVVREFVVAPENDSLLKNSKFAALVLDDDTIGLTFVALDQAQHDLNRLNIAAEVQGSNPLALCAHYALRLAAYIGYGCN